MRLGALIGLEHLRLQSSDNALSVRRSLISHGHRSDLAKTHLLEAGIILPRVLGLIKAVPPGMIEQVVPRSIDVFLRGYGMPEHLGIADLKREAA